MVKGKEVIAITFLVIYRFKRGPVNILIYVLFKF